MTDIKDLPAATYSRREAAAFFGISVRTLDRIQQTNTIPYVRVGRRRRYLLSDLQNYLKSNRSI
jgi:excisionase family DNA binding protein